MPSDGGPQLGAGEARACVDIELSVRDEEDREVMSGTTTLIMQGEAG